MPRPTQPIRLAVFGWNCSPIKSGFCHSLPAASSLRCWHILPMAASEMSPTWSPTRVPTPLWRRSTPRGLVTPTGRGEAAILVRYLEHIESVPIMFVQQIRGFHWTAPEPHNYIDQLVNAKLQQLQYLPSATCSDAEFLRRVYLDVIGILPTVEESKSFLADKTADKRARLIDDLLQRDEFAKFWALKWGDLLKMTSKLVGDEGVYKYHRWVEAAFRTNMPYDQFARSLLTASGSTLANPPANFYRTATDMNECVETVSQVFLGARLQCAKCHNHPFERWTQDNYYGLGAFFNRVQRRKTQRPGEMFVWTAATGEVTQPRTGQQMKPWLPAGGNVDIGEGDRRDALADWLVKPDNPYFAKIEANRIWSQCLRAGSSTRLTTFAIRIRRPTRHCWMRWPKTSPNTALIASTCCGRS